MKRFVMGMLAGVLAAGVVLSTGVLAAPPWAGKRGDTPQAERHFRPSAAPFRLGVLVAALTPELAEKLGIDYHEGVVVLRVIPGSPAAEHLEKGDIITHVNGSPVATPHDLMSAVKEAEGSVTLTVVGKGDIVVDLSSDFLPPRPHPRPKPLRCLWPLRLLGPELEGIPAGERFSHIMGAELRVTDKDGVLHTLALIPGTVKEVSGDELTLLTNEGNEVTYIITKDVKGHRLLKKLHEGQKLIVVTVDGEVRAIFPPYLLRCRPHRPVPRPLGGMEDGSSGPMDQGFPGIGPEVHKRMKDLRQLMRRGLPGLRDVPWTPPSSTDGTPGYPPGPASSLQ